MRKVVSNFFAAVLIAGILPSGSLVVTATLISTAVSVAAPVSAQADNTTCYKGTFSTTCTGSNGTTTCYNGTFSTTCSGTNGTTTCYNGTFSTTCSGTNGTTTCYNGTFSTTCSGTNGTTTCYNGTFSTTCSGTNGTTTCYNGTFSISCSGSGGVLPLGGSTGGTLGGSTGGTLGGSTGGTLGGSTGGSTVPSCTRAPELPELSYKNLIDGIQFTASAKASGEKPSGLYYSYAYFDGIKNSWDDWSAWFYASPSDSISYKAASGNNKTYVAFAVYSSNSCGQSIQARENTNHTGLKLPTSSALSTTGAAESSAELIDAKAASTEAINAAKSAISQFVSEKYKCIAAYALMDPLTFTKYSDSCSNLDNEYDALSKKINEFSVSKFLTVDQANNGTDAANLYAEEADSLVAKMQDLTTALVAASRQAATKKITITCIKGKTIKKVTAVNPKCPSGYKKK